MPRDNFSFYFVHDVDGVRYAQKYYEIRWYIETLPCMAFTFKYDVFFVIYTYLRAVVNPKYKIPKIFYATYSHTSHTLAKPKTKNINLVNNKITNERI